MKNTTSFLEIIQQQVAQHLNAQELFQGIPVISHQENNFKNSLSEFTQTNIGLSILIMNPIPLRIIASMDQLAFEDIQLRIQVIESSLTNTSQINALNAAEYITKTLHNFRPSISGWKGWLKLEELHPWTEVKDPQKTNRYIIEINFHICGSTKLN